VIPLSKDEIVNWTPPSLGNLATPPVFKLRPATSRDGRAFQRAYVEAGLMHHTPDAFRAETLKALNALSSEDAYDIDAARLQAAWESDDQGIAVAADEEAAVDALVEALRGQWQPLRKMIYDNHEFNIDAPRLAIGLLVVGWTNLDVPFTRAAGVVPMETVEAMQTELLKVEDAAIADKVAGVTIGLAFNELAIHAFATMAQTKEEAGNSAAPSPSVSTPSGSTSAEPPTAGGTSRGKSTSKTRPAA